MQSDVELIRFNEYDVAPWTVVVKLKDIRLGNDSLTCSERAIVGMIAEGLTNAEIAAIRGSSARTIANQVAHLLSKLSVGSRVDLVAALLGRAR